MLLMDALALITFWIFFNAGKNLYEQPTIYGVECPLFQCSLMNKTYISFFCNKYTTFSHFKRRFTVLDVMYENWRYNLRYILG